MDAEVPGGRAVTRDPIIPSNIRDRTGTAGILRRAIAQINRRFAGLRRDVFAIWDGVRVLEANDAAAAPRTIDRKSVV